MKNPVSTFDPRDVRLYGKGMSIPTYKFLKGIKDGSIDPLGPQIEEIVKDRLAFKQLPEQIQSYLKCNWARNNRLVLHHHSSTVFGPTITDFEDKNFVAVVPDKYQQLQEISTISAYLTKDNFDLKLSRNISMKYWIEANPDAFKIYDQRISVPGVNVVRMVSISAIRIDDSNLGEWLLFPPADALGVIENQGRPKLSRNHSILSDRDIRREIDAGNIIFTPSLKENQYQAASVDLTLDGEFQVVKKEYLLSSQPQA